LGIEAEKQNFFFQDAFDALKISGVVVSFLAMIIISLPLGVKHRENNLEVKIEDNGNYQSGATIDRVGKMAFPILVKITRFF